LNFLVLAGFLYWLLAKKIKEFFAGRRDDIKIALEQAMAAKEEAEKNIKNTRQSLRKPPRRSPVFLK